MDLEEEEAQPKFEATFHSADEEIKGEDCDAQDSKKRKPLVEPAEVVIQKGRDGIFWQHV
eukprot:CAMPEP_0196244462 /NCGR_PEP_ID=MMETSP0913-20130531/30694_1 /TAXON_ID=49265 /ORGANISM="Thalassiosira rotula, Strain GSO102" /LENGTH=59 /DNA_ID=CAMNT_0041528409 /DNA_START=370 /DNA_END=549 /DNA_ORIENTATION=+